MKREYGRLEAFVLHSPKLEESRDFYEALLGIEFREEKHGDGPKHYAGHLETGLLLELYPPPKTKMLLSPTVSFNFSDPSFIFNIHHLEETLERIKKYTNDKVEMLPYGARVYDPDGRTIVLHRVK